ncbi:hypothetical protein KR009_003412 [Drosophila setifemur]|nr:hypothetical protein KR009_003412 [Drosophila setifemur]
MASYTCKQYLSLGETTQMTATTFTLDASHFGQCDLNLFIESLETISRFEKKRYERKLHQERILELDNERCPSPTPSAEEAVDENVMYLEAKCIPYVVSDVKTIHKNISSARSEYYNCSNGYDNTTAYSPLSSVTYCSCDAISSQDSDSAESGVYGMTSPPPLRPRSQVITQPKDRSTRSRLISMVLKQESLSVEQLKPKDIGEHIRGAIRQQYSRLMIKSRRGKPLPEERFLDKAMRYLTL